MSTKDDLEKPMARAWWERVGGYLCWQYPLVRGVPGAQPRTIDALVRHDREHGWLEGKHGGWSKFGPITRATVTCLQVKACRLNAPLFGQTFFSALLARRAGATLVSTVALCTQTDAELEAIALGLARQENIELSVVPQLASREAQLFRLRPDYAAITTAHASDTRLLGGALSLCVPLAPGYVAHGAVFLDGPWEEADSLDGRKFMLLSNPGRDGFGMYVLGEALFGRELARRRYPSASIDCGVVVPRKDTVMADLARQFNIAVFPPPAPA